MAIRACTNCGRPMERRPDICPHCGAPNSYWGLGSGRYLIRYLWGRGEWREQAYKIGWRFGRQVAQKTKHWHKGLPTRRRRKKIVAEYRRKHGLKHSEPRRNIWVRDEID
jgi:hypothetical protein